ncbi:MBL fold metallo-hydrolase [bacterium]|nr:MBL fold metallo-hydrolase [bacterium]
MKIFPIASSSDGNCTFIKTGSASILIDCGLSLRQLRRIIGSEQLNELDAVFITHEHSDHIKGLDTLSKKLDIPVYMNHSSYMVRAHQLSNTHPLALEAGMQIQINDLKISPFEVEHDTVNTFGFMIEEIDSINLCYLTDCGRLTEEHLDYLCESDVAMIEFNYNEEMLASFPDYDDFLKARITETHLSNSETLNAIEQLGIENFDMIIPAHLSPRTNSPKQLISEISDRFPASLGRFFIAPFGETFNIDRFRAIKYRKSDIVNVDEDINEITGYR